MAATPDRRRWKDVLDKMDHPGGGKTGPDLLHQNMDRAFATHPRAKHNVLFRSRVISQQDALAVLDDALRLLHHVVLQTAAAIEPTNSPPAEIHIRAPGRRKVEPEVCTSVAKARSDPAGAAGWRG